MPVVAVNVIKVLFVIALYGFLFYVARAMRGHVAGPPVDPNPTPSPPSQRRTRAESAPPPAPRQVAIEVDGPQGATTHRLVVSTPIVVGRGSAADVTIDDEYSSDRHARFEYDGELIWVEDLGSTNGTRIGEVRITERTELAIGAEVIVGRTKVVIR